jgi:CubicO group peptidase (beta-lactamase class C family)
MSIFRFDHCQSLLSGLMDALLCTLVCVFLLSPNTVSAQAARGPVQLSATDLEPWLDGFMANALRVNEVQGAAVVVVKDGKVLVQKGYGYSDAANRTPVDPENTMFRPASISKLFVWTSVMQLVEQGKIDLDADINTYLDFKIAGMGGKKITMRHLMTHRAGFEEVGKSGFLGDPALLKPLDIFVKSYIPKRIFAPGSTPAYSNYGASLAGYIVQRVSGAPFQTYVERNIFAPLGMAHSTFRQPLPKTFQPFMSKGYKVTGGEPQPFEMMNDMPAGALSASSGDIARFMIAHLDVGGAAGNKILKPETMRLMHRSLVKDFPDLNGAALGFYENNVNGHKVIVHGGDLNLFHSDLSLFIDGGIGIYITMNSTGNGSLDVRNELLNKFADRYMPSAPPTVSVAPAVAKTHLAQVVGAYQSSRRLESSFGRLANLFSEFSLSASDDGFLILEGFRGPKRFREIRPYLWQEVNGKELLSVKMQNDRPVVMSFNYVSPAMDFRPIARSVSAATLVPAILLSFAVILIAATALPFSIIVRKFYGVAPDISMNYRRLFEPLQLGSISLATAGVTWLILIVQGLSSGLTDAYDFQILLTQAVSLICVLIAAICIAIVIRGLFSVKKTRLQILGTLLWLAASIFMIWFYCSFNMLKIGTNF